MFQQSPFAQDVLSEAWLSSRRFVVARSILKQVRIGAGHTVENSFTFYRPLAISRPLDALAGSEGTKNLQRSPHQANALRALTAPFPSKFCCPPKLLLHTLLHTLSPLLPSQLHLQPQANSTTPYNNQQWQTALPTQTPTNPPSPTQTPTSTLISKRSPTAFGTTWTTTMMMIATTM